MRFVPAIECEYKRYRDECECGKRQKPASICLRATDKSGRDPHDRRKHETAERAETTDPTRRAADGVRDIDREKLEDDRVLQAHADRNGDRPRERDEEAVREPED